MNDPACFRTFVQNVIGINANNPLNAITQFVPTFTDLLMVTDEDIQSFVTTTHGANSGRAAGDRIVIPQSAITGLQSILFELRDRQRCNALPDLAMLQAITAADLRVLRRERSASMRLSKHKKNDSNTTMDIPQFKGNNFDEFMTAFKTLVSRHTGANELPLDYLMRDNVQGNYNAAYASREQKLKTCVTLNGDNFRSDSELLYSLYVEHIGTTGIGSSTVNKFKSSKNGYSCHRDFVQHYVNRSYQDNKAQTALQAMANAVYSGPKRNFTIETYYSIMTTAFNDLDTSGPAHVLNNEQKIAKFEAGLKEANAINFAIQAKSKYDSLPAHEQSFDAYYNEFSALMTKYATLSQAAPAYSTRNARINATSTNPSNPRSSGRGRGRGRGRTNSGKRGRGGGRTQSKRNNYHPYANSNPSSFAPIYGNFIPEAKMYSPEIFNNLTPAQKKSISDLKSQQGWLNATTPPQGFTIDENTGRAVPSTSFINAIQTATIAQGSFTPSYGIPPPQPGTVMQQPPSIINVPPPPPPRYDSANDSMSQSRAGANFSRSGSRTPPPNSQHLVGAVSINGQPYNEKIYDRYGNPLN